MQRNGGSAGLTWSFSGLSDMSFRLLEVRFRWVVVGLSVEKEINPKQLYQCLLSSESWGEKEADTQESTVAQTGSLRMQHREEQQGNGDHHANHRQECEGGVLIFRSLTTAGSITYLLRFFQACKDKHSTSNLNNRVNGCSSLVYNRMKPSK